VVGEHALKTNTKELKEGGKLTGWGLQIWESMSGDRCPRACCE